MRLVVILLGWRSDWWIMFHCQQLSCTRRVQHRSDVAEGTDNCLERVLSSVAFTLGALLVLFPQVLSGAAKAEVMVTSQDEHVVWQLAAPSTRYCFLFPTCTVVKIIIAPAVAISHVSTCRHSGSIQTIKPVAVRRRRDVVVQHFVNYFEFLRILN
jgi:hypothetical protein